ncbi:hypothetical protein EJV47_14495 [Hymenobacter gummosus]|uniref:DUF3300 domain-containing protein n=1 Tax=Hymenobacter gummosus TaxID=1776032 RepID=A0A3S0QH58_9BACT|nr:hypothetical protein [Hymenobacter gummosus]RTQ48811.1 hypothetical protein EJV47_14495 [Hymenobacter gummosus]
MNLPACFRLLFVALLLVAAGPARAQLADREVPAPRGYSDMPVNLSPLAALDCAPEQLLRALANELHLQPHQALALRRTLLAAPAGDTADAEVPAAETLRLLLSEAQLDQLQRLTATPGEVLTGWVAAYR